MRTKGALETLSASPSFIGEVEAQGSSEFAQGLIAGLTENVEPHLQSQPRSCRSEKHTLLLSKPLYMKIYFSSS